MGSYSGGSGGGTSTLARTDVADIVPIAGKYYSQPSSASAFSLGAPGDLKFQSIYLPACSIASVGIHISTAAGAGGVGRCGLYSGASYPATLLAETAPVATDGGAAPINMMFAPYAFAGGRLWIGTVMQVAVPSAYCVFTTSGIRSDQWTHSDAFPNVSNSAAYVRQGVTGALPATNGVADLLQTGASIPKLGILFA